MVRLWAVFLPLILAAGCTSQAKLREAELAQILQSLPGEYDNTEQVETDSKQGKGPDEALALVIAPVYAPRLGQHVFYAQEMAARDSRRIMAQRLWSFDVSDDEQIVQSMWSFAEPPRWRDGHLNPDLFKALQPQDVQRLNGCELLWKKTGEQFTAAVGPQQCRMSGRGGSQVFTDYRIELGPDEVAISDRAVDAQGKVVSGRTDEPFYRFRRRDVN